MFQVFFKLFKGFVYICCAFLFFAMMLAIKNQTLTLDAFVAFITVIAFLILMINIKVEDEEQDSESIELTATKGNKKFAISKKTYEYIWKLIIFGLILGFSLYLYLGTHIVLIVMPLLVLVLKFFIEVDEEQ